MEELKEYEVSAFYAESMLGLPVVRVVYARSPEEAKAEARRLIAESKLWPEEADEYTVRLIGPA
jgi:hypothetical protein